MSEHLFLLSICLVLGIIEIPLWSAHQMDAETLEKPPSSAKQNLFWNR